MRIVPVLDLKDGVVVRGVGGRRDEYRPVVSRLTASASPPAVARAFGEHLGLSELYLADLDAIRGERPATELYAELSGAGHRLWVDAGIRDLPMAQTVAASGAASVVVGLETVAGPQALAACCAELGERLVFSLDLKGGRPIGDPSLWQGVDPLTIAAQAIGLGVRRLLVLDLARVGERQGTGTEDLCRTLADQYPDLELAAGGGVRGLSDVHRLQACGVSAVLVASALHDGTISRSDLDQLRPPLDGR